MHVGAMVWRIGNIDGFYEQFEWLAEGGFEGVAFHTAPSFGGGWASFDVRQHDAADRERLKEAVKPFRSVTIHAESFNYDVILESPNDDVRAGAVQSLERTLDLAAEIGAVAVTVHRGKSSAPAGEAADEAFRRSVSDLSSMAGQRGVTVGFEIEEDFSAVTAAEGPVGITLDIGHVARHRQSVGGAYPAVPDLVRVLDDRIVHVHVHDFDGTHDHITVGSGHIDIPGTVYALTEIGYDGMLCLELNPDRCSPDEFLESKRILEEHI
ncbi:MAG: sugar phosphate isomerase/epimerase family protein [Armatimonadota bacterium]